MMGIYEIRNTINNKVYIGSSTNIPIRWKQHIEGLIIIVTKTISCKKIIKNTV